MYVPLILEYGKLFVLPLFASLPNKEQHKVFTDTPNGYRKIILATNIAETSITIPGVKYVIDTGMVKAKGLSHIILTDNQVLIQTQLVGNKAKGQISKRVFQENKSRQILRKTNISSFHLVHSWIRVPKGLERMEKLENRPFLENGLERLDFCFWKNSIYL